MARKAVSLFNITTSFFFTADKIRYLTMTDSSKVWMPDTFFRNEKIGRFHNILQANLYVRVFPNGDVLYSIRVSLTCACSMHLQLFPLDKQTCNLDVASYGWTMNDLIYRWKENNPVQMVANLSLPGGFQLDGFGNLNCDVKTATGKLVEDEEGNFLRRNSKVC